MDSSRARVELTTRVTFPCSSRLGETTRSLTSTPQSLTSPYKSLTSVTLNLRDSFDKRKVKSFVVIVRRNCVFYPLPGY